MSYGIFFCPPPKLWARKGFFKQNHDTNVLPPPKKVSTAPRILPGAARRGLLGVDAGAQITAPEIPIFFLSKCKNELYIKINKIY